MHMHKMMMPMTMFELLLMNTVHIARHQKKEWPSHARRRSRKGTGVYCIQQFVTTSSMFKLTDHYEHICFLIGANEGCKKKGVVPSRVYQQP